jgi:hypothetical protein
MLAMPMFLILEGMLPLTISELVVLLSACMCVWTISSWVTRSGRYVTRAKGKNNV